MADVYNVTQELIERYDVRVPRYTSYPPATAWHGDVAPDHYADALASCRGSVSLYIHFPFCRERCHFCGCNAIATHNRAMIDRYLGALLSEIDMIAQAMGRRAEINAIHFGGGSPDYIPHHALAGIIDEISRKYEIDSRAEIAIEVDPAHVDGSDIVRLRGLGVNRLSLGVQDLDRDVQAAIGRRNDRRMIAQHIDIAKDNAFRGVAVDLVYGLPRQRAKSFAATIESVVRMKPDRVALFNFAYLPRMLPHQKRIPTEALPQPAEKIAMFARAIELLQSAGYIFIGLDHFVRRDDPLALGLATKTLSRNFQGYALKRSGALIGIGSTAIGAIGNTYVQNEKKLIRYLDAIEAKRFATARGYVMNDDDRLRAQVIEELMCYGAVERAGLADLIVDGERAHAMVEDGLMTIARDSLEVTKMGRLFLRNVASLFDNRSRGESFSRSI